MIVFSSSGASSFVFLVVVSVLLPCHTHLASAQSCVPYRGSPATGGLCDWVVGDYAQSPNHVFLQPCVSFQASSCSLWSLLGEILLNTNLRIFSSQIVFQKSNLWRTGPNSSLCGMGLIFIFHSGLELINLIAPRPLRLEGHMCRQSVRTLFLHSTAWSTLFHALLT